MSYEYTGKIFDVTDGDTLRIDVDLGFGMVFHRMRVRLNRINAPEKSTPEGAKASSILRGKVTGVTCEVTTIKDRTEKYGRYLGEIIVPGIGNLSDWMVSQGLAVYWDGHGMRPCPVVQAAERGTA